jgi:phosphoribosyl 1,2-cyclic phosphodiesterase
MVAMGVANASPDLRQQIAQTPALHADPKLGLRHSPIKAVVLTNGDVDHIIGLINLREAQPFSIYVDHARHAAPDLNVCAPDKVARSRCARSRRS